jgi:hypothetical protein
MRLAPKGLFLVGLGGMKNYELANELHDKVLKFMTEKNVALFAIDGKIKFVELNKPKKRRWFNWLQQANKHLIR